MRLSKIAGFISGDLRGNGNFDVSDIADYRNANCKELSFISSEKNLKESSAGALIIPPDVKADRPSIISRNPKLDFAKIITLFRPVKDFEIGIHETVIYGNNVQLAEDIFIGPYVVIEDNVSIGNRTCISSGVKISENVIIGEDCKIFPNVVLYPNVVIGARVTLHAGVIIGSDGFGYVQEKSGSHLKFPQTGTVIIEDDVEIGANSTIDRGTIDETRVCSGTKIDNQVQVAHNVLIGENCLLAAQVGIAGSVKIGKNVYFGGQSGSIEHVEIEDNVKIAAKSAATKKLKTGKTYFGFPAEEIGIAKRKLSLLRRLPDIYKKFSSFNKNEGNDD
jgi:UDP-3-O-[3-hydroxymyristoyl] glucosamine N-acyltransferase